MLLAATVTVAPAQSDSTFEPGTKGQDSLTWESEANASSLPPVKRPAIELARSRITTVWVDRPWEVPSAESLATGIVSDPRDQMEEELDAEERHRRNATRGRLQDPNQVESNQTGWLSLVDLYSTSTLDDEDSAPFNPDPAPEPGTLVVLGGPVAWALLRRRARSRVNPQSAGSHAVVGVSAKNRRRN
ncbi:MAG: hypothetical protein AB7F50_00130 [Fimbriimonadaceae bacterium]